MNLIIPDLDIWVGTYKIWFQSHIHGFQSSLSSKFCPNYVRFSYMNSVLSNFSRLQKQVPYLLYLETETLDTRILICILGSIIYILTRCPRLRLLAMSILCVAKWVWASLFFFEWWVWTSYNACVGIFVASALYIKFFADLLF